jgi:hypothetical protein
MLTIASPSSEPAMKLVSVWAQGVGCYGGCTCSLQAAAGLTIRYQDQGFKGRALVRRVDLPDSPAEIISLRGGWSENAIGADEIRVRFGGTPGARYRVRVEIADGTSGEWEFVAPGFPLGGEYGGGIPGTESARLDDSPMKPADKSWSLGALALGGLFLALPAALLLRVREPRHDY